jgi:CPA2 family monovalent cation:H+ antiporter-2
MHELAPLISDLAIMLGLAGVVVILFQRIRQPVVLGYLAAGMILGPYTPPHALVSDVANIQTLSELGVIFLMFSLGLEFSFQKLTRVGLSATLIALIEVICMLILGYTISRWIGWSSYNSLFLGAALSISSTTIIVKAISELGVKNEKFAQLVFGTLIVEDLIAILLLVGLSTLVATRNVFSPDMVSAGIHLILVIGGWFLTGYFLVPTLFLKITNYINEETLTIISVALCLSLVCFAAKFNYSPALGAFIMGSILAETTLIHRIEKLIQPIRDIFAAIFFISVGMLINPVIIIQHWQIVLLFSLVTILGKMTSTCLAALCSGQNIDTSVKVGFSMAQIGEFSFIIVTLGMALKVTNPELYPLIVAISSITTFTTPYLIRSANLVSKKISLNLPRCMKELLHGYDQWLNQKKTHSPVSVILRAIVPRLLVNSIIIALIFIVVHYCVIYYFGVLDASYWIDDAVYLSLSIFLAAPFIWGMLFSFKKIKEVPSHYRLFLALLIAAIWLGTLLELTTLSILNFYTWVNVLLIYGVGAALFMLCSKPLGRLYNWYERHLLKNLRGQNTDHHKDDLPV